MKRIIGCTVMLVALCMVVGCLDDSGDPNRLTFENLSNRTVTVIPLSTEWASFRLESGETKRLDNIRNTDHRLSPDEGVQRGSASTDRYIVIVDKPPS